MRNAHAESQRAHRPRIAVLLPHLLQHQPHPRIVSGVQALEFRRVVAFARPPDRRQVGVVVQPEILERAEQPALERIPEPHFHRDVIVEVVKDVFGVGAFGRGGQPQEDSGRLSSRVGLCAAEEMFEQPPIRRRRRMMELVDNHDVERGRIELRQIDLRQGLNGRKHVPPLVGPVAVHVELAEVSRSQDLAERAEALPQDFLSMGHKQQAEIAVLIAQALVVERGDDGLAGSRRGHDKILEAVMPFALHGELLEHLALVGPRFDIQEQKRRLERVALLRRDRAIESRGIPGRFIGFVFGTLPVRFERGIELLEDVRRAHLR